MGTECKERKKERKLLHRLISLDGRWKSTFACVYANSRLKGSLQSALFTLQGDSLLFLFKLPYLSALVTVFMACSTWSL